MQTANRYRFRSTKALAAINNLKSQIDTMPVPGVLTTLGVLANGCTVAEFHNASAKLRNWTGPNATDLRRTLAILGQNVPTSENTEQARKLVRKYAGQILGLSGVVSKVRKYTRTEPKSVQWNLPGFCETSVRDAMNPRI